MIPAHDSLPIGAQADSRATDRGASLRASAALLVGGRLRELAPLVGPLAVLESVRTRPIAPVAFTHAKIVHIMSGSLRIRTAAGERTLSAGDAMVLGGGMWCEAIPSPQVRAWTIYLDQDFLRAHMLWALPGPEHVRPGLHPAGWDGRALFFHPGAALFVRAEPLMRKMSVISHQSGVDAAAKLMALFAHAVELSIPVLVTDSATSTRAADGVVGPLAASPVSSEARRAAELMRTEIARPWLLDEVAGLVALSKSQLSRRFIAEFGLPPMRWLTEIRTTEFSRLIEETTIPVEAAARLVGWADRRVAATWFRHRFGVSPTQFRRQPPPACIGEAPCVLCPSPHCLRIIG